jgi:hypothetical protein
MHQGSRIQCFIHAGLQILVDALIYYVDCNQYVVCRASGAHLHVTRMSKFRLFQRSLKLAPRKGGLDTTRRAEPSTGSGGNNSPPHSSYIPGRGRRSPAKADHSAAQRNTGCSGPTVTRSSSPHGALKREAFTALPSEPVPNPNRQV